MTLQRTQRFAGLVLVGTMGLVAAPLSARAESKNVNWPSFRGPGASGSADGFATATKWNVETGENIKWKTDVPGLGLSSPIVWGDRIYVTTAVPDSGTADLRVGLYGEIAPVNENMPQSFRVLCLDKKSGKILWDKEAYKGVPKVKRHTKASHANSTPATDGKHVVAFFGAEGLYCFTADGELKWKKDFGPLDSGYYEVPEAQWGFGNSPVIHEDKVVLQVDVQKDSFVAVLNIADGSEAWRTSREEVPTWCTPTIHKVGDVTQVICNGYKHIGSYDFATGKKIWWMKGAGDIPVPTPVVAHDLIYLTSAHGADAPIYAVKTSASGDITLPNVGDANEGIAWSKSGRGNYMQTPLVYGDHLYMCKDNGIYTVYDAKSGKQITRERIGGGGNGFTASMIAADGKIYLTSETGDVYVLKAGTQHEVLAKNELGNVAMATPAVSEGLLLFRTSKNLIAVGSN